MRKLNPELERCLQVALAARTPADEDTLRKMFPKDIVDQAMIWRKIYGVMAE